MTTWDGQLQELIDNLQEPRHRGILYLATPTGASPSIATIQQALTIFHERIPGQVHFLLVVEDRPEKSLRESIRGVRGFKVENSLTKEVETKVLGQTFHSVVFDLRVQFVPNDFVICIEACTGPGLIILLGPPLRDLPSIPTRFFRYLLTSRDASTTIESTSRRFFTQRLAQKLGTAQNLIYWDETKGELTSNLLAPDQIVRVGGESEEIPRELEGALGKFFQKEARGDQLRSLSRLNGAIMTSGTPSAGSAGISITGDRGRGKSALVGMWLAQFFLPKSPFRTAFIKQTSTATTALITSADLLQVQEVFHKLTQVLSLTGTNFNLLKSGTLVKGIKNRHFAIAWEPADEVPKKERVALLVVDEAGTVPASVLLHYLDQFRTVVMVTTTGGYEGTGQAYLQFILPSLRERARSLTEVHLETPIRYGAGDPVERFVSECFLLGIQAPRLEEASLNHPMPSFATSKELSPPDLVTSIISQEDLFADESLLREFWTIVRWGHYRNSPNDLAIMGDHPRVRLLTAHFAPSNNSDIPPLLGAAQVVAEGGLQPDEVTRKARGDLIPIQLGRQYQVPELYAWSGYRVVRIATLPLARRMGVGSGLLQKLEEFAHTEGKAWCGAAFNLDPSTLAFWVANGYVPLFLSPVKRASNPEFSITVVKPLNDAAREVVETLALEFREILIGWLRDNLYALKASLVVVVLETLATIPISQAKIDHYWTHLRNRFTASAVGHRRLEGFLRGELDALVVVDVLDDLLRWYWSDPSHDKPSLSRLEAKVSILRLMGRSWTQVSQRLGIAAQDAYGILKKTTRKLVRNYIS